LRSLIWLVSRSDSGRARRFAAPAESIVMRADALLDLLLVASAAGVVESS